MQKLDRGWVHLEGQIEPDRVAQLAEAARTTYDELDREVAESGPWAVAARRPYQPTASSIRLDPVPMDILESAQPLLASVLGPNLWCNLDQSWLRRQFPPNRAPSFHHPHSWHQDGALGADFADPKSDLLHTLTAWCPLTSCGIRAPSIELADRRYEERLPLDRLTPSPDVPRISMVMIPGDVLLMTGDLLHRTFVTDTMDNIRISVELRVYGEPPVRLSNDRLVRLA